MTRVALISLLIGQSMFVFIVYGVHSRLIMQERITVAQGNVNRGTRADIQALERDLRDMRMHHFEPREIPEDRDI